MRNILNIVRMIWPSTKEDAKVIFNGLFWILYLALGYKLIRVFLYDIRPRRVDELAVITVLLILVQSLKSRILTLAVLVMVTLTQLFRTAIFMKAVVKTSDITVWAKSIVSVSGGFVFIALLIILTRAVFVIRGRSYR